MEVLKWLSGFSMSNLTPFNWISEHFLWGIGGQAEGFPFPPNHQAQG